jgi:hypothetical protein
VSAGVEPPASARTVSVAAERLDRWLAGFAERHGGVETVDGAHVVVLTGADGDRAWIEVPFPPLSRPLVDHVLRDRTVGVLLVRRSGYAVGVFEGTRLVASKVDSTYVQGTTKAGGWSQQRFARRRANQARDAFAAAADVAARLLVGRRLDAVVAGGDRAAIRAVLGDHRLAAVAPLLTEPWLAVKDPKLHVLEQAPAQFRAVRIHLDP